MTITDITPVALDLRGMTDGELLDLYQSDGTAAAAALAEAERRDQAGRMEKARRTLDAIRGEGERQAYAQYREADQWCRGELLSKAGKAAGITDEQVLWRMPWEDAQKFASEELGLYWLHVAPRITAAEYVRQQAAERRRALAEARDEREASDGHDHDATGRAGLAEPHSRPLRRDPPAPQAPQAGPGRHVQRGGPRDSSTEGDGEDGSDGRPGGPVRRAGIAEGAGDMTYAEIEPAIEAQTALLEAAIADADAVIARAPDAEYTPGDLKFVLDETAEFVGKYVSCTKAQATVMTLFPSAANARRVFPAFGEVLFTAPAEQAGKTTAMAVTAALCARPVSAKGTVPALQSTIAGAANEPEKPAPVLYYDEIGGLYGDSGLNRGGNWVLDDVLRDGYKNGATRKWSVNRSPQEFSIYIPVLMTGRGTSLPRDIRSRTIVVSMEPGTPGAYFDMREAQPKARELADCLAQAVASQIGLIAEFRAIGIHPKLIDRKLEVWEPLFAVAWILGGQEWLNRCLAAFRELAIADSEQVTLTPRQKVIKDLAAVTAASDRKYVLQDGTEFMGGLILRAELRALDGERPPAERRYQSKTDASLGQVIVDALPMSTVQLTVPGGERVRGYYAADVLAAWDKIRPDDPEDAEIPEEIDPLAVDGEDSTGPARAEGGIPAGQHEVNEVNEGNASQ